MHRAQAVSRGRDLGRVPDQDLDVVPGHTGVIALAEQVGRSLRRGPGSMGQELDVHSIHLSRRGPGSPPTRT